MSTSIKQAIEPQHNFTSPPQIWISEFIVV